MVEGLTFKTWFAYGVGHVLNDVCASMWFTYLLMFFKKVLQFSDVLSGTALLIGQVADGISTPIVGILADKKFRHWIFKYGRRKLWHLIGTICVICSFPFIFSPYFGIHIFGQGLELLYYSLFIILFQFGWASTQISHLSLVPDLTPYENERISLFTIRFSFTVLSNIMVYFIFWNILRITQIGDDTMIGPTDEQKFQTVAYIVVVIGSLASLLFHSLIQEKAHLNESNQERQISRLSVLRNKKTYDGAAVYMSTRLFVNLGQIYIPLYLHDTLELPSTYLAVVPLVMYITGYVSSSIIKPLNAEFGRKLTYAFAAVLGMVTCIWIWFGHDYYYRMYQIYGVVAAYGCFGSIMLVTSLSLIADLIGANTDTSAFTYGLMSFCDKISSGIAVFIIEYLRSFNSDVNYYRNVLSLVCGSVAFFGLISVLRIEPSDYYHRNEDLSAEIPNPEE